MKREREERQRERKRVDEKIQQEYESKYIPFCIATNVYDKTVDEGHFDTLQQNYMQRKKNLEIRQIRENKKTEVLYQILAETAPMHVNRKQNRVKAKNAIKTGKAFSEQ